MTAAERIISNLESDTRFRLSQASRERAQLDTLSVYWACKALLEQGRTEEARARWLKFKTTGE